MKKIYNYLLSLFVVLLFLWFAYNIKTKKNQIDTLQNQLNNIEKPFYIFENGTYEHNFFKYSNVEFSSYTNRNDFYGLQITDRDKSNIELYVYCKINESLCKVEFKDLKCLDKYLEGKDILDITPISLNEINCSGYYTIKGNVSKRIY